MAFIKPHIVKIAKEFWSISGQKIEPPFDIIGAVNLVLPIDIISLSELSIRKIELWLDERNITLNLDIDDRRLHGFILNFKGSGFIFINGTESEEERRYTVAHEASHFILDYKLPREKAIKKLGIQIKEVLDGDRKPTTQERIDGMLTSANIQPYMHLLEKVGDGSFKNVKIFNSENYADALALELLAPHSNVIRDVKEAQIKPSFSHFQELCCNTLIGKYRLPGSIAKEYSLLLAYSVTGGPSLMSKFGF